MTNDFKALLGENYEKELREEQKQLSSKRLTAMNPLIDYIEAFPNVASFVRGLGKGVSLGATDPLAALALQYTRKFTGGPETTFKEAHKEIKSQKLGGPGFAGELAGGTITGAGLGLGKTLLGTMRRGAAMGAVSGATASPYSEELLPNIGIGAGTGGLLSLLGGFTAGPVREAGVDTLAQARMPAINERAKDIYRATTGKDIADFNPKTASKKEIDRYNASIFMAAQQVDAEFTPLKQTADLVKYMGGEAVRAVVPGALGAVGGAVVGLGTGVDPMTSALYGAGGAAALSKIRAMNQFQDVAGDIAGKLMYRYGQPIERAAAGVATTGQYVLTSQLAEQLANYRANEAAQEFMMRQQGQQ